MPFLYTPLARLAMPARLTTRFGRCITDPSPAQLQSALAELDLIDHEHTDCCLTEDRSEWGLSAFPSGLVVWENAEDGDRPMHMTNISRAAMLQLWLALLQGRREEVESQPWQPGYGR